MDGNRLAEGIRAFLGHLDEQDYRIHALMIAQGDEVIYGSAAAPYTLDTPHRLFSAAKSILVLSSLCAMQEGLLRPEDCVADYFPEYPVTDPGFRRMTVDHLLTMRTGQRQDPFPLLLQDIDADLIRAFFETPVSEEPGTQFRYNNTVPHMIYKTTERAVKEPFEDYQNRHFCIPMEAPLYAPVNEKGQYNPAMTCASARTFMKFAQLFLGEGTLKGRKYLEPSYLREAVKCHTRTGMEGNSAGYGWQIWENSFGGYRMDGGWGQYAILLPEEHRAVILLSDMTECAYALEAFERDLLPALRGAEGPFSPGTAAMPELASLAPCGNAVPDEDLFRCDWTGDGKRLRLYRKEGCVGLSWGGRRFTVGINTFAPNEGYRAHPLSIDHSVYGADSNTVLLGGAWTGSRTLELTGKCFAETGETYCRFDFGKDRCQVRYMPGAVHGIAGRSDEERKEVVLDCSRINC